jgi:predicted DNA-binding transcriptional regulator AlpA
MEQRGSAVTANNAIDYVRSRRDAARILGVSVRTLDRLDRLGNAPRRTRITDRLVGYRDSAIKEFLDARTAGAAS